MKADWYKNSNTVKVRNVRIKHVDVCKNEAGVETKTKRKNATDGWVHEKSDGDGAIKNANTIHSCSSCVALELGLEAKHFC